MSLPRSGWADCRQKWPYVNTERVIGYWQNSYRWLNDEGMTDVISKEVAVLEDIEEATSKCI